MRVLLRVEYKGVGYCGWQRQKNGLSVQEVLANAVREVTGKSATMHGSGRTDAKVHAMGQAVHFDTDTKIPLEKLPIALNAHLPSDVRVLSAVRVEDSFNARFDALSKTYLYKLYCAPVSSPLREGLYAYVPKKPNVALMRLAAEKIIGEHDFKCFQAAGGHVKTTVRRISSFEIEERGDEILFEVTGNGFLYNMVRIMVGTLYYVGIGKLSPEDVEEIIASGDRTKAGKTMPPEGLYLKKVVYPFELERETEGKDVQHK
ncbi:MAG: tRNA pseudouridine(38-40) synthase TruA [Clostridia bacterium]|nr:tRNA pseudouridine(38-40) synthase TruA [Clostridia bacterium]